jgi:hypothetical protein
VLLRIIQQFKKKYLDYIVENNTTYINSLITLRLYKKKNRWLQQFLFYNFWSKKNIQGELFLTIQIILGFLKHINIVEMIINFFRESQKFC